MRVYTHLYAARSRRGQFDFSVLSQRRNKHISPERSPGAVSALGKGRDLLVVRWQKKVTSFSVEYEILTACGLGKKSCSALFHNWPTVVDSKQFGCIMSRENISKCSIDKAHFSTSFRIILFQGKSLYVQIQTAANTQRWVYYSALNRW